MDMSYIPITISAYEYLTIVFLLQFSNDFLSGPSDSLFADLTDIFIPSLMRLALFSAQFGKLHQNKAPVAAILGVELHHCMGSSGRAREEVENDVIVIFDSYIFYQFFNI